MIDISTSLLGQTTGNTAGDLSLTWAEVGIAACFLAINAFVSLILKLGLARQITVSAIRMTVQLAILGLLLKHIFELSMAMPVLGLAALMTLLAGLSAVHRINIWFSSIYPAAVFSVWVSSWIMTGVTVLMIVRPTPWYSPQVVIPLLGMVLGNSLTGISLGLERFLRELRNRRGEVEALLTLGATRWESCRDVFAGATRTAMIPILNTMSVAGIVSIPGMMTGQLLADAPPMQAVKYQVMIMFVIAAAIALGVVIALGIAYHKVTTPDHQIDWDQIQSTER